MDQLQLKTSVHPPPQLQHSAFILPLTHCILMLEDAGLPSDLVKVIARLVVFTSRELIGYTAKLAEQAQQWEGMASEMVLIASLVPLGFVVTVEERNLFAVAFKNLMSERRAALKKIMEIVTKSEGQDTVALGYCHLIEKELKDNALFLLGLLDRILIPVHTHAHEVESMVFFHKMRGDYLHSLARNFSERPSGCPEDQKFYAQKAEEAYLFGVAVAKECLPPLHAIRLAIALNFSVFLFETVNEPEKACFVAKEAFDDAIPDLNTCFDEDDYKDCTVIMSLLRDNLTLWTSPEEEEDDSDCTHLTPDCKH